MTVDEYDTAHVGDGSYIVAPGHRLVAATETVERSSRFFTLKRLR
jgi:hypothetical protein